MCPVVPCCWNRCATSWAHACCSMPPVPVSCTAQSDGRLETMKKFTCHCMSAQRVWDHPGPLLQAPRQVFCAWGLVLVIHADDSATCLTEKPLAKKVELLYNKNLYPVALSLARSEQVGL